MATPEDAAYESLVAVGDQAIDPEDPASEQMMTVEVVRELTADESDQSTDADALLRAMITDSPFADLKLATDDLHDEFNRLDDAARGDRSELQARVRKVQREFKNWLSNFRSFDDRTSSWLSESFGKNSEAFRVFKTGLSREFDHNFAYRLCYALRNVTEHSADVLNAITLSSRIAPSPVGSLDAPVDRSLRDETDVLYTSKLGIDGPKLAARHDQIRARTRAELIELASPIHAETVVGAAFLSCLRVQAELMIALWPEVDAAVGLVEGLHREALDAGGGTAWFVTNDSLSAFIKSRSSLTFRANPIELAELARQNEAASRTMLAVSPAEYLATDFLDRD